MIAVKEASGNIEQLAVICRDRPRDVAVLAGDDAATLAVLAMGGDGVVSVASNQVPGEMAALCAAGATPATGPRRAGSTTAGCPCSGPTSRARPNPVPAKAALLAMGLLERDDLRAPLLPLADAPRARLVELLRTLGLVDGGGAAWRRATSRARAATPGRRRARWSAARHDRARRRRRRPPPTSSPTILDDLDAGTRRAAVPDPAAPGGWRADPEVKAAILARFRDRATTTWDLGGALAFRDRVGLPLKRLLDGPEATRRSRRAGRGGSCPAGPASGPAPTSARASSSCRRRS